MLVCVRAVLLPHTPLPMSTSPDQIMLFFLMYKATDTHIQNCSDLSRSRSSSSDLSVSSEKKGGFDVRSWVVSSTVFKVVREVSSAL